jgi:CheY-like chemotaxis protein
MFRSTKKEKLDILVVDDDRIVALLHKNQIRRSNLGPSPQLLNNGKEAFHFLRKKDLPGKTFLLLLDLNMPVMNGWELLQILEKEPLAAKVLVIIVTSSINKEDQIRSQKFSNVIGFCRKPLDPTAMRYIKNLEELNRYLPHEIIPAAEKDN